MDRVLEEITLWLKGHLITGIMNNLGNAFDSVNQQVGEIATNVGMTPSAFQPGVFSLIRSISETVIMPIAGIILTFIACYELIQLVIEHNNMANFETYMIWKWVFKTFIAVTLISNTFNITMAVFDVASSVIRSSGSLIQGSTAINTSQLTSMQGILESMELGALLSVYLQSAIIQLCLSLLGAIIFVIIYGRMIEIYLMVSLAPIPFSTFGNKEQSSMGQNYLKSLLALGFQGFLIMICVGIYAVLIQRVSFSSDIVGSLWADLGYTILLAFTLFKTSAIARSVLQAH